MATRRRSLVVVAVMLAGCPASPGLLPVPRIDVPADVAVVPGDHQLTVTWSPVAGADGYVVSVSGSEVRGVSSPFVASGLANTESRCVAVAATSGGVVGPSSALVCARPGKPGPRGLAVTPADSAVLVAWECVPGATQYGLTRWVDVVPAPVASIDTTWTGACWSIQAGLENGLPASFTVRAQVGGEWTLESAPVDATPSASAVACATFASTAATDRSVTASGLLLNPAGAVTTVTFEFGATQAYGQQTAASTTAVPGESNLTATLGPLPGDADVHYRVVARTAAGTCTGEDRVARTWRSPEVVVDPLDDPVALVVLGDHVYVAQQSANRIARVPKAGGLAETFVVADRPSGLATDGTWLYVADAGGLRRIDPGDATSSSLATYANGYDRALVVTNDAVLSLRWTGVFAVPLSGGAPGALTTQPADAFAFADGALFWSSQTGVWKDALGGAGPILLASSPSSGGLVVASGSVLFPAGGAIYRVPVGGGVPAVLWSTYGAPRASDATAVYWADGSGVGTSSLVYRAPLAGGPPAVLAYVENQGGFASYMDRGAVAVDDTHVYWISRFPTAPVGSVFRARKD